MTKTRLSVSPSLKHGGARNWGSRLTDTLRKRQCIDIIYASRVAYGLQKQFNRFITIHWQKGGIEDGSAARATGLFIKYCSDWMRHHNRQLMWLWVRENDGNTGRIGSHVHILLHVPMDLAPLFRPFPLRWVKRIVQTKYVKGTLMSKTIPGYATIERCSEFYLVNLDRIVEYLLKAVSRGIAINLKLTQWERRGIVTGKRSAVSQHLLHKIKTHPAF